MSNSSQEIYKNIQKLLIKLNQKVPELFCTPEVLNNNFYRNPKLTQTLSFLEYEINESLMVFTDLPNFNQFLKIYELRWIGEFSDIINDLEYDLDQYNFECFNIETQNLAVEVKFLLLTLCQQTVKLHNIIYNSKIN